MGKPRKQMRRIQAMAAGTLTLSMVMGAALPAWAAETDVGSTSYSAVGAGGGTVMEGDGGSSVSEEVANIDREEAEVRMKELFPILRKAKLEQISFGSNSYPPASEAVWNMHWSVTSEDGRSSHGFSMEMDATTGDVLSMFVPESVLGEPAYYPPKLSREEARKAAEALIAKAIPSLKDAALKTRDDFAFEGALFGPFQYTFVFETDHRGIPAPFRTVHLRIDGNGNVTQLSYRPLPADMPEAAEPIAKETAWAAYEEHLDLQLTYVNLDRYGDSPKWTLAWMPSPSYTGVMDAVTGDWIGFDGQPVPTGTAGVRFEAIAPSDGAAFQAERPAGETITRQRAEAIVSSVFRLPEGYALEQHSLQDSYPSGRPVWRLVWGQGDASPFGFPPGVTASVDAETGQIYEIRQDRYHPFAPAPGAAPESSAGEEQTEGEPISEAEARRKADDLVAKLYPDAARTLKRVEGAPSGWGPGASSDGYAFTYQPFLNGYPLQEYSVSLRLSKDGQLESYSSWGPGPAPEASELPNEPTVGEADAERRWLERSDFVLQYERFGGFYVDNGTHVEETTRLTYRHEWKRGGEEGILDAATGEWVKRGFPASMSEDGEPVEPNDIAGHAAEEDLRTLARFRVLDADEDGRANPDAVITREQWARWLAAAADPYYESGGSVGPGGAEQPYYTDVPLDDALHKALQSLVQMRWLDVGERGVSSFGPGEAVKREELAVWAAHVLGYDRLAELLRDDPEIAAASDFERIAHPGAAALAVKLDLLGIENGRWAPDRAVTRGEAASFLMELVRLQASVDQPSLNGRYY